MEKKTRKKATKLRFYSEKFLARFDELYIDTPKNQLIKILQKEFPLEMRGRSTSPSTFQSLAYRRGLTKQKGKEEMNDTIVNINPSTPDVDVPGSITFGHTAYPVELLRAIGYKMSEGLSPGEAYKQLGVQQQFVIDKGLIPALGNLFRLRFNRSLTEFVGLPKEAIDVTLQREQRTELVRILKNSNWRDVAIIEKTADLFPDLDPLTLADIKAIRNFWRAGKKDKRRVVEVQSEIAPTVKDLAKITDSYTLSISGPLLQYKESVTLTKAKSILRAVLAEERP